MTNKRKYLTTFQLKEILAKGNPTEEETQIMMEMLWDKYGTASYGMCIHPYWLLNDAFGNLDIDFPLEDEKEEEEVRRWKDQEYLDEFDEIEYEKPNPDISILCKKPGDCPSRKRYGNACKCVRENFRNQEDFIAWQKEKMTDLKDQILKILE